MDMGLLEKALEIKKMNEKIKEKNYC